MIEVENLSKRYGDKLAVDSLDFVVPPGTVTGFLGPNGAGKSTTMRMIAGLDEPTAGRVLVNGRDYRAASAPMAELAGRQCQGPRGVAGPAGADGGGRCGGHGSFGKFLPYPERTVAAVSVQRITDGAGAGRRLLRWPVRSSDRRRPLPGRALPPAGWRRAAPRPGPARHLASTTGCARSELSTRRGTGHKWRWGCMS